MHRRSSWLAYYAAGLIVLAAARPASAQKARFETIRMSATGQRLGDELAGATFAAGAALTDRLDLWLGIERSSGAAQRTGSLCNGLVAPGTCVTEPIRDDGRAALMTGALELRAFSAGPVRLGLIGEVERGRVTTHSHGETTNQNVGVTKTMLLATWGASLSFSVHRQIALRAAARSGKLSPNDSYAIMDGYSALDETFPFHTVSIGAVWSPRER